MSKERDSRTEFPDQNVLRMGLKAETRRKFLSCFHIKLHTEVKILKVCCSENSCKGGAAAALDLPIGRHARCRKARGEAALLLEGVTDRVVPCLQA